MNLNTINKKKIDYFIIHNNIPNLLMYGPYLNGKEEMCDYLIHSLYKKEDMKKYVLTINCLSNSGIKMIKENIKLFSMQIINKINNIFFKTIILQYCEYLTYDSQYSLRRTIEQFSNNTRFILLCENKHKLLNPICSRFVHIYINYNNKVMSNQFNKMKYTLLNQLMKKYNNDSNDLNALLSISNEFYMNSINAYEILYRFKKNKNYNIIKLVFDKITSNLRNEELCIFYLLLFFRNNNKIQISELY
jgi:DNA polymerase III delta prime subunit